MYYDEYIPCLCVCVPVFINHQILLIIIISQHGFDGHELNTYKKGAKVIITTTKIHDDDDKAVAKAKHELSIWPKKIQL